MLDRSTARITTPAAKIFNLYGKATVHGVDKLDWQSGNRRRVTLAKDAQGMVAKLSEPEAGRSTAIRSANGGYWCIYTVQVKFAFDDAPNALGVDMSQGGLSQLMLDVFSSASAEVLADEFELTKSGWRSPTARKRMSDRQAGAARAAASDAQSRCISCNGTGRTYGYAGGRMYSHQCWTCGGRGKQ